jgi:tRNA (guanine37-N1)-methyltransferase
MFFDILTLFPGMFDGVFSDSIVGRAVDKGLVGIHCDNIRDYADDKHHTVDDYPYGGDPGMLLKPGPLCRAIAASRERLTGSAPKVILLCPRGELFTHAIAQELSAEKSLILVCGRYKGVDQRVCDRYVDREISIGDYVLSGGEVAAMAVVDAVTRLVPGVLGNSESPAGDSFYNGLLSPPSYTRPEVFEGMAVPQVLVGGNHKLIEQWKREQALDLTRKRRPDVWRVYCEKIQDTKTGYKEGSNHGPADHERC